MKLIDGLAAGRRLYPRLRSDLPDIMLIDVPSVYASPSLPLGRYYPVMIETPLEAVEFERFLQSERPFPIVPDLLNHRPSMLQGQEIMLCHYDIADENWPFILLVKWPAYCTALAPHGDMFARNAYTFELFTHRLDRAKATQILRRSLDGAPSGTQLLSTATQSEP